MATVDGHEVPATITFGAQTYTAPRTFTLEEGKRYPAEIRAERESR